MSIDSLRILPPELRQCVYSHLLFDDQDGTTQITRRQNTRDRSHDAQSISAVLGLPSDPNYIVWRRKGGNRSWPDEVQEAFFKGLRWTSIIQPLSRKKIEGLSHKAIICEIIYELTGQEKQRKQVSSHIQVLKGWASRTKFQNAQSAGTEQVFEDDTHTPAESFETAPTTTQNSASFWTTATTSEGTLQNLLSLSLTNSFYRPECLHHLTSNHRFDFGLDTPAFHRFCSTAPAGIVDVMRHLRVTLVEGWTPDLPAFPNLRTLAIDLWPRRPTLQDRGDRGWGKQTETLLAALGLVVAAKARISLEMRWTADWERFEREYVGTRQWRRVTKNDERSALGPERSFCPRCYELRGNERSVAEVAGQETEVPFWDNKSGADFEGIESITSSAAGYSSRSVLGNDASLDLINNTH